MPQVSIIIPCYNEENTIALLLQSLYDQTFPRDKMEVVISDGMSQDRTLEEIEAFQQTHPELVVRVVENRNRTIPQALNIAIEEAAGEFIVRMDAHSVPYPDYVANCMADLKAEKAENVGGVWEIQPGAETWMARSIAFAAAHPFGVGDAKYRFTDKAEYVDTVPFGSFRRALIDEIGPFDETLLANEDYEFNTRIHEHGGKVWLNPAIRARYFARPTLGALGKQYRRYGTWKVNMLRRYPYTLRYRQAIPPLFVLSLLIFPLLVYNLPVPLNGWAGWLFMLEMVLYGLVLLIAGMQSVRKSGQAVMLVGVPLAITTMHLMWGGAFLWRLLTLPFGKK